jgi:4-amino-4-deoxy-L-arabinose transferase-like glycosyltransferase
MTLREPAFHRMRAALFVFLFSVLTSIAFVHLLPAEFRKSEDVDYAVFYKPVAENVLSGRGLVTQEGGVAVRYPPGYPLYLAGILAVTGKLHLPMDTIVMYLGIILMAASAVLVFSLAKSLWGPRASLLLALAWALYPLTLWVQKQTNTETLYIPILYLALLLLWRLLSAENRRGVMAGHVLVGMLLGLSMLVRPAAMGLGLLLALFLPLLDYRVASGRSKRVLGALLLAGNLVVVLPWVGWVYVKTGTVIPLSTGGPPSVVDGLTFSVNLAGRRRVRMPSNVEQVEQAIWDQRHDLKTIGLIGSAFWRAAKDNPVGATELLAIKIARSWYATDSQRLDMLILLMQLPCIAFLAWGLCRALRMGGKPRQYGLLALLLTGYSWIMATTALSVVRYMLPVIGLLFVLIPAVFHKSPAKPRSLSSV